MPDKVGIFIDAGYFDSILRDEFNQAKIDYQKLVEALVGECGDDATIFRSYYYNCEPYQSSPPTEEEKRRLSGAQKFFYALKSML